MFSHPELVHAKALEGTLVRVVHGVEVGGGRGGVEEGEDVDEDGEGGREEGQGQELRAG